MQTHTDIALAVFELIRDTFPDVRMEIDESGQWVDLEMSIPVQPGCSLEIDLNLQNHDELHLETDEFWVSWFPCTNPEVVTRYVNAVTGLIDGSYRILRHSRRGRVLKAQLQQPTQTGWRTVATSRSGLSILTIPSLWSELSVLRNDAA